MVRLASAAQMHSFGRREGWSNNSNYFTQTLTALTNTV
jgi:hypothetical protein